MAGYVSSGIFKHGRLSKSVAGGANVTLTTDESRNGIMELTGALTADISVIVETLDGMCWLVFNNTTSTGGPWALTVKTAAGSGIVVQQGKGALLYCNGTNVLSGLDPIQMNAARGGRSQLTFASDANKTLTEPEYDNATLDFVNSGTALSATRNVVVPITVARQWTVRNFSAGGQSIQVIGASGTGITIAASRTAIVACDLTNIVRVTADST